jgi:hypothetical protein
VNCYECAKAGTATVAVGICPHCHAGLCLEHMQETALEPTRGGTHLGCLHDARAPLGPVRRSA